VMRRRKTGVDPERKARLLEEVRRQREQREKGYREQALKLFPHVCGRCGREFSGAQLRELTVHHKDSDHMNNPPDGSNWELLCLYCHDNEHEDPYQRESGSAAPMGIGDSPTLGFQAFEGLLERFAPSPEEGEEKTPEGKA
jgi:hypothetical protein